ncbi:MAG: histidine kinase N-terminal 7TM domain-containing protein [Dehalococcoidia bacterium]|nr:histidine kinase N-terminal 7TM domain-containing protein [Dehalococcoidia bacterium]MDD5494006.1 histidine kinase N-terminal 7TM domain-containing protein [Dehalococcoidia bacterium]
MHIQYVPYVWLFAAAAAVTLALAVYALLHRDVRGALPFGLCMLFSSLWAASYGMERSGTDLPTILFWSNMQFLAYGICPVLWLIMVFLFIERDRWVTARNISLLLIIPAIMLIMVWSGDPYSLLRQNIYVDTSGDFPVLGRIFGPAFWILLVYADTLNILSMVLMGWTLRRKSILYRRQVLVLFTGLGLVMLQNAAYLCGIYPAPYINLTSVVIGISGLIIAWGIFSFRLFDIVPVARENIIEHMADGLIVLDADNRIADINLTAKTIFGKTSGDSAGQDAGTFFSKWPEFIQADCEKGKLPGEMVIETGTCTKIFEVSCTTLYGRSGKRTGTFFSFHDVTEQREAQARLLEKERALAASQERERMAKDLHDDMGQVFGFINVQAQAIRRELSGNGINVASTKLDRLIEVTQSAHGKMREYIHNIKNIDSVEMDFFAALKQEVEQFKKQAGINIRLDVHDDSCAQKLKTATGKPILSIIKEALNNAQKHAGAKDISIAIRSAGGEILAVIADDGSGFDPDQLEKRPLQGLGLNIMKERAVEIGGRLEIDTAPGKGTRIILSAPLHV